ncbi:MAG: lytic transglycosylase domain-containing protein [Bacteriovoracaceae bacterium]|nr:lytic transglycosylase domain-containing protein [Bacteriovoracaceae bacterium]
MFLEKLLLTFTIIVLASTTEAAIPSGKNHSVLFDFPTTRNDQILAKEFYSLNLELKRKSVRTRTMRNIEKRINKSFAFYGFKDVIARIKILRSNRKLIKKFNQACPLDRKESNSSLHESYHKLVDRYCRDSFSRLVKSKKIKLKDQEKAYITTQLDEFIKYNPKALSTILSSLERESFFFGEISKNINNKFISSNLKPIDYVLSKIKISNELTNHFQERGLLDSSSKRYFISEFKRLTTLTERQIIKNNIPESKTTLSHALGFYIENKKYLSKNIAWKYLTFVADEYRENNHKDLALDTLDKILSISGGAFVDRTLFKVLTTCLNFSDVECARKNIKKYQLIETISDYGTKLKFWIGRSLEFIGETKKAVEVYDVVSRESPLDFYSILASKQHAILKGTHKDSDIVQVNLISSSILKEIPQKKISKELKRSIVRTSLWLDNELDKFVEIEALDIISSHSKDAFNDEVLSSSFGSNEFKRFLIHQIVKLYNHKKQYLLTFKLVYRSIEDNIYDLTDKSLRFLFPLEYVAKVKEIDPTIDPLLILSLIRQESAFNPKAKSHVGARGLMQLMPKTARMFKKSVKAHHLKKPKLNLNIGIKYFKRLLKRYDGNLIYTLAAYNAGETRVKRWRAEVFNNPDPLLTIENIPFKETRNYVKYIYRNLYLYNVINDSYRPKTNIADTFHVKVN